MVWFIITILGVLVDQASKWLVQSRLADGRTVTVIPGFFRLQYHVNTGAAWSFLSNAAWGIYLLSLVSAAAAVLFLILLIRIRDRRIRFCLSLILAGTVGNLIDRVINKGVIDFLSLQFGSYYFPIFNVADMLLVVGLLLTVICLIWTDSRALLNEDKKRKPADERVD